MSALNRDFPHADRIPRAPTREQWESLSPGEREQVVEALPSYPEEDEFAAPEGDYHSGPTLAARDALQTWFRAKGRAAYVGRDLMVYYPGERRFAPDLFVVLDVDPHPRHKWVVGAEGRGLDFVMEVIVSGDRRKDLEQNVENYARLEIPEYFVFDQPRHELRGWRLREAGARYRRIVPQSGGHRSDVLDMELRQEGDKVRFFAGSAPLLESAELAQRIQRTLEATIAAAQQRVEEEARRAQEEARRAEEEARRAREAEARALALQARLDELEKKR